MDTADLPVGLPSQQPALPVALLPQASNRECEQGQRGPFAFHGGEHLVDDFLLLKRKAVSGCGLHEGTVQRSARGRLDGYDGIESRRQRLVLVAADQKVVAH
jgi:hypothetical protein